MGIKFYNSLPLHIKSSQTTLINFYLYLRISLVRIYFMHLEISMIFVSQNSPQVADRGTASDKEGSCE